MKTVYKTEKAKENVRMKEKVGKYGYRQGNLILEGMRNKKEEFTLTAGVKGSK